MSEIRSPVSGEQSRAWTQVLLLLATFGLGFYQFVYKDIIIPKGAPINITMDLQLSQLSPDQDTKTHGDTTLPVKIAVTLRNPSTRPVYLFKNIFIAYGYKVTMLKDDVDVTKSISEAMDAGDGYFAERYSTRSDDEIIGGGSLFTDKVLQPNETIARTKVIYLPKRTYDLVRVGIRIPTAGTNPKAKLTINWKMIDKFPREVLTKIDENGNKHRIDPDEDGQYSVNPLEFQMAGGEAELALGR